MSDGSNRPGAEASIVDLSFPLSGGGVPVDHGYALYSALSATLPAFHKAAWLGVHPIRGQVGVDGMVRFARHSRLTLRIPVERLPFCLALAGCVLDVAGCETVLGPAGVEPLRPSPSLDARLVSIRLTHTARTPNDTLDKPALRKGFEAELGRQLEKLEVRAGVQLLGLQQVTVGGKRVLGYSVRLDGLSPSDSLKTQAHGLGGKRRMGCGVFVPTRVPA